MDRSGLNPLLIPLVIDLGIELTAGEALALGGAAAGGAAAGASSHLPPINWGGTEPGAGTPPIPGIDDPPIADGPEWVQPLSEPGCNVVQMAKGGKQNIRNEWTAAAQQHPDPCAWLRQQYQTASAADRQKIKRPQKALGCRTSSGGGP